MRDRMRAALIYVSEYAEMKRMMTEGRYNNDDLLVRLRAVFGRVDQVRQHIDVALQQDDAHRRKRNMRFLISPTRFPRPESMGQGDIAFFDELDTGGNRRNNEAVRRRKGFQKRSG